MGLDIRDDMPGRPCRAQGEAGSQRPEALLHRAGDIPGPANFLAYGAGEETDDEYRQKVKWKRDVPRAGQACYAHHRVGQDRYDGHEQNDGRVPGRVMT